MTLATEGSRAGRFESAAHAATGAAAVVLGHAFIGRLMYLAAQDAQGPSIPNAGIDSYVLAYVKPTQSNAILIVGLLLVLAAAGWAAKRYWPDLDDSDTRPLPRESSRVRSRDFDSLLLAAMISALGFVVAITIAYLLNAGGLKSMGRVSVALAATIYCVSEWRRQPARWPDNRGKLEHWLVTVTSVGGLFAMFDL